MKMNINVMGLGFLRKKKRQKGNQLKGSSRSAPMSGRTSVGAKDAELLSPSVIAVEEEEEVDSESLSASPAQLRKWMGRWDSS